MYTSKEAEQLLRYYQDRMLRKAINSKAAEALPITDLKIEEQAQEKYELICYAKCSFSIGFFRDIRSAAKELGLAAPSQVLEKSSRL